MNLFKTMAIALTAVVSIFFWKPLSAQQALIAYLEGAVSESSAGSSSFLTSPAFSKFVTDTTLELSASELHELIMLAVSNDFSITIGQKSSTQNGAGTSCKGERFRNLINGDEEFGSWYLTDRVSSHYGGLSVGKSVSHEGEISNIVTYNTDGISGFTVNLGLSVDEQCREDPECVREMGQFGTVLIPPRKKKVIQCMGATISDPDLIQTISSSIESSAQQELEIKKKAENLAKFVTVNAAIQGEAMDQVNWDYDNGELMPKPQPADDTIASFLGSVNQIAKVGAGVEDQIGQGEGFGDINDKPRRFRESSSFAIELVIKNFD